ncbi:MAG: hypothetical protein WBP65_01620 [Candidatus Sulfotelmatobacter sp.]
MVDTLVSMVRQSYSNGLSFAINVPFSSLREVSYRSLEERRNRRSHESDSKHREHGRQQALVFAEEEFFVLPYLGPIQNTLGRMRTIIMGSLFLFVAATFSASSYPFDPLPVLGGIFLAVFLITGGTVITVYAGMNRDATLSHITNTRPGELGGQFWLQLITFGIARYWDYRLRDFLGALADVPTNHAAFICAAPSSLGSSQRPWLNQEICPHDAEFLGRKKRFWANSSF